VVVDGAVWGRYDNLLLSTITFSPDGHSLAFIAAHNHEEIIVVNNQEMPLDGVWPVPGTRLRYNSNHAVSLMVWRFDGLYRRTVSIPR
jgi:hypothetical protein